MLILNSLQLLYDINLKEQLKVLFYSNKYKYVQLTLNPETEEFDKHLMIYISVINLAIQPSK